MIKTRQPVFSRAALARKSLMMFASNFAFQKSGRVLGMAAYLQPA
jgi:hypothetical protein